MRRACIILCAVTATAFACIDAQAAYFSRPFFIELLDQMIARGPAGGAAGNDMMSIEELTACLRRTDELDMEKFLLASAREQLGNLRSALLLHDYYAMDRGPDRDSPASKQRQTAMAKTRDDILVDARIMIAIVTQRAALHDSNIAAFRAPCSKLFYRDQLKPAISASGMNFDW